MFFRFHTLGRTCHTSLSKSGSLSSVWSSAVPLFCKWPNFILLRGWIVLHCIDTPHFPYSFICWQAQGWFHILALVNGALIHIDVQVSLQLADFNPFVVIPRSGTEGSNGNSVCSFLSTLCTSLYSYTELHSSLQCSRVPYTPACAYCFCIVGSTILFG